MFRKFFQKLYRWVAVFLAVIVMGASLPQAVFAAAAPYIDILSIKADERVTIRTHNFPANVNYTVRMDRSGNQAINGIVVGEINSGSGGSFDIIFRMPAELKGAKTISIRFESSANGAYFNWFNNKDMAAAGNGVPVTGSSEKPYIKIVGVRQNELVTVETGNFPANVNFRVRVGPFDSFFKNYVVVDTINSGSGGAFRFTVKLPDVVQDVDMVTIRLDGSQGSYAFNAFHNTDSGTTDVVVVPTPLPSATCEVVSVRPARTPSLPMHYDFDAVWTIKNTSSKTWDSSSVDYVYVSGAKSYKWNSAYDLPQTVKPGETVKIVVDMLAPGQAGQYTSNWAVVSGSTTLCKLPITFTVR